MAAYVTVNAIGPHLPYEQASLDFLLNRGVIFGHICEPHSIHLQPNHDLLFKLRRCHPCMVTPCSVPNCSDATCNTIQHGRSKPLTSQRNWLWMWRSSFRLYQLETLLKPNQQSHQIESSKMRRWKTNTISLTTHTDSTITPEKQESSNRLGESKSTPRPHEQGPDGKRAKCCPEPGSLTCKRKKEKKV